MKHTAILYVATLVVMAVLDFLWIGVIAREFYANNIGPELEFQLLPAIAFYVMYVVGVLVFVSRKATQWQKVALTGALFGFIAYGTYDLTNMATLKGWTWIVVFVDMAWGTFNTAFSATLGWLIARRLIRS